MITGALTTLRGLSSEYVEGLRDRLETKLTYEPNTGCWLWIACANNRGYGEFGVGPKVLKAHRVSLVLAGRELVDGLVVDHICRNTSCVNPAHLRQVTQAENMRAPGSRVGLVSGARNRAKTHCLRGHLYDEQNTQWQGHKRSCRTCRSLVVRR
jgi:hypothetical protein